jgi:hypothetical protein
MEQVLRKTGVLLVAVFVSASTWGCATMAKIGQIEPNIPYEGPYPVSFEEIRKANALLGTELLKLPEFQDGMSADEEMALINIVRLYIDQSADFDSTFERMYKVGLPDIRRYCSPLQAIFWLSEDGQLQEIKNLIANYSLRQLLQTAWNYDHDGRWQDFQKVIERLNSPELVDYYERTRIHYDYISGHREDMSEVGYVFAYNKGHCAQITAFTVHILTKNGYKAWRRIIANQRHTSPKGNHHRVCVFEANGKKFVMDNGRGYPFGIIPYDQYDIDRHPYGLEKAFDEVWDDLQ